MHRIIGSLPPGLLAAGPALLVLLLGPLVLGGPGAPEVVADGVLRVVPPAVFDATLGLLGPLAKGLLFAGVAGGVLVTGWLLAKVVDRIAGPADPGAAGRGVVRGVTAFLLAVALAELLALPLAGAGFVGSGYGGSAVALHAPIVAAAAAYGVTLALLPPPAAERPALPAESLGPAAQPAAPAIGPAAPPASGPGASGVSRRSLLAGSIGLAALAASGILAGARIVSGTATSGVTARREPAPGGFGPTPAITPVEDHYTIAKGITPPTVDAASWRLVIDGLVARPVQLTLDEVRGLATDPEASAREGVGPDSGRDPRARTLICISNEVRSYGPWAGTQLWTGAPVAAALAAAGGPLPEARFVLWTSADDYTESIPLDVALDERSLLAWGMGEAGEPLPVEHGFPLRVLLPGRYGMKQPKWLTRITLAAEDEPGYWVQRGWDRDAVVRTWSRMDDPRDGDTVPAGKPLPVFGVAFAGERGIRAVEVSLDDGATWFAADLEAPSSALAWVRWRATLPPPAPGAMTLRVRATDGTGALQPSDPEPPLPRGAAGWQEVRLIAT